MKKLKRAVAIVMSVLMVFSVGGCANPEPGDAISEVENTERGEIMQEKTENEVKPVLQGKALTLYQAEYPQMAKYPETNGFLVDEAQYEAWRNDRNARRPASEEYKEGIREYTVETVQEFLTDIKGENRVYSPLNVYMALAMLAETTAGESREQILELLHTDSIETLREKVQTLWNANYCEDGTVSSLLASSIWMDEEVNYQEDTLKILAENYYASSFSGTMGSPEYNQLLQSWLNEQTGGLLEEQVSNVQMDAETILALATTVYFRAKWDNEFNPESSVEDIFHAASGDVTCEFMKQSGTASYYWGNKFSAVVRRLENSGNMMFLLPDEGVTVEELLGNEEALNFLFDYEEWENQKRMIVHQSIPKFDVVSDFSLINGLKNLGISDVFNAQTADFTPLTIERQVQMSNATHAARVKIDEEGCVAAAYTVMLMAGSAMPPKEEVDFVLDRPFLFVINGQDGQPLFVGVVNQPN